MDRGLEWVMGRKSVLYRLIGKPFKIAVSIERPVFIHATHKSHERRQHKNVIPAPQAPHSISLRPSTRQRTLASCFTHEPEYFPPRKPFDTLRPGTRAWPSPFPFPFPFPATELRWGATVGGCGGEVRGEVG